MSSLKDTIEEAAELAPDPDRIVFRKVDKDPDRIVFRKVDKDPEGFRTPEEAEALAVLCETPIVFEYNSAHADEVDELLQGYGYVGEDAGGNVVYCLQ